MQYVRDLDHLSREVAISYTDLGPVYVLKSDVSDGLYRIALRPADAPNFGLVFPSDDQGDDLVAIMLTLPMVFNNTPPIFCMFTETVADLSNAYLRFNKP